MGLREWLIKEGAEILITRESIASACFRCVAGTFEIIGFSVEFQVQVEGDICTIIS